MTFFKTIKKFFKEVVWEYFPPFMMIIVFIIMFLWERNKMQDNIPQLESCNTLMGPQPEIIEY